MVLRLLANTFVSQQIESVNFSSCPRGKLFLGFYHYPSGRRKLHIPPEQRLLKINDLLFPQQKGGGGLKSLKHYQN